VVSFPSRGQTTVNVPLNVSFLQTGAAVAQAIRTGVAEVKLDAILNAAGASLPVKVAKTVEPRAGKFARTGSSRTRTFQLTQA